MLFPCYGSTCITNNTNFHSFLFSWYEDAKGRLDLQIHRRESLCNIILIGHYNGEDKIEKYSYPVTAYAKYGINNSNYGWIPAEVFSNTATNAEKQLILFRLS